MSFAPVPSSDEILRQYKSGELAAELARHHDSPDGEVDPFVQLCVELHNSGNIDVVSLPSQPGFASITGHDFFAAQHFYCQAIPELATNHTALMECCRIIVEQAGHDGAAMQPNQAFLTWCQNNPDEGAAVIREACTGNGLAKQFVTFALQAANDMNSAIHFVLSYVDDRRLSGMTALARMTFADVAEAQKAIAVLEPFVADSGDDHVRGNALLATFEVLQKHNDLERARALIIAAARDPGPQTLDALARILWLHRALVKDEALRIALSALEAVNPEHLGTVRTLDMGLRCQLATMDEAVALDFLAAKLRDERLTIKNFETTAHELTHGDAQRLYELIVRWFLSGSIALCNNIVALVGFDMKAAFDTTARPLGLTTEQQIFVGRKAIGFLFLKPVICCSILVSILRAGNKDVEGAVSELLFDPILLSYGGAASEYLNGIPATDPAHRPIQSALAKARDFYAGLAATGEIKELHPSDYQRDLVYQRSRDEMHAAQKMAEHKSVLLSLARRSVILYGKRSVTYVTDYDGSQRALAMELKSFEASFELPRREILDPVGLDYMLRVYRVEKLK